MAAKFCTGVVRDEQAIGVGRIWWNGAELVPPQTNYFSGFQFSGDEAHRIRALAGWGHELKSTAHTSRYHFKHCWRLALAAQPLDNWVVEAVNQPILKPNFKQAP